MLLSDVGTDAPVCKSKTCEDACLYVKSFLPEQIGLSILSGVQIIAQFHILIQNVSNN